MFKQATIAITAAALLAPAAAHATNAVPDGGGGARGVALPKISNRTTATIHRDKGSVVGHLATRIKSRNVVTLKDGQSVKVVCQLNGQTVTGKYGTSGLWDLIAIGGGRGAYVTDTFVYTGSDGRVAPSCSGPAASTPAGPNSFPPDVTSAPDPAKYDYAGPWRGQAGCSGGFTKGAARMQTWLRANFGAAEIQGYNCRPDSGDTSQTSIHGVGRANDWFRDANSAADRATVNSFIQRMTANGAAQARAMGVQYWIWNRMQYSVRGSSIYARAYTGPDPHINHVHIELNLAGSRLATSYWRLPGASS